MANHLTSFNQAALGKGLRHYLTTYLGRYLTSDSTPPACPPLPALMWTPKMFGARLGIAPKESRQVNMNQSLRCNALFLFFSALRVLLHICSNQQNRANRVTESYRVTEPTEHTEPMEPTMRLLIALRYHHNPIKNR